MLTRPVLLSLLVLCAAPFLASAQCDEGPHGAHDHAWEAGLAGGVFNGQRWRIDRTVRINEIQLEARIPSGRTVSWLIYEGPTEDGPWTQAFRQDTTSPGPNAYVWHGSGPMEHELDGGWIVVGAHIGGSFGHSGGVGANPAVTWFGEATSGANVDGNPTPPEEVAAFGHNYWTPTRMLVDPDCEGDDDDSTGDDDDSAGDDDDSAGDDDDSAVVGDDDDDAGGRRGGCGCAAAGGEGGALALLALLGAVGVRRRRG